MNVPGLKVVAPSTATYAKGLLKSAIRDDDPVLLFAEFNLWSKRDEVPVDEDFLIPIGTADFMRAGSVVTFVSLARFLHPLLAAASPSSQTLSSLLFRHIR